MIRTSNVTMVSITDNFLLDLCESTSIKRQKANKDQNRENAFAHNYPIMFAVVKALIIE